MSKRNIEQLERENADLRHDRDTLAHKATRYMLAIEEVESMLMGPTSGAVVARVCLILRKTLENDGE